MAKIKISPDFPNFAIKPGETVKELNERVQDLVRGIEILRNNMGGALEEVTNIVQIITEEDPTTGVFSGGYDITASLQGLVPRDKKIIPGFVFVRPVDFPINFDGSKGQAKANATAQTDFDIRRGALGGASSSIGTISFAAAAKIPTWTVAAAQSFVVGDYLEIIAPTTPDATLIDVSFTLKGQRLLQ